MGLYKGIVLTFRFNSSDIVFWIMWNDDFDFDEVIHGVYRPRENVVEVMLHASPARRGLVDPRIYYLVKNNDVKVKNLANKTLVVDGVVVSFWDDIYSEDSIYSISDTSCESALRKLSAYSHTYNSNSVYAEVVPFKKVIELLKDELYGKVVKLNILYLLMRKTPDPLGLYRVDIVDYNGVEKISTTLPLNHKYVDPPEYVALFPNDMESCFVDSEADEILCVGYGGKYSVSIKRNLVEKYIVNLYGDIQVVVTRYVGTMFNGRMEKLQSTPPGMLYHITYGRIL